MKEKTYRVVRLEASMLSAVALLEQDIFTEPWSERSLSLLVGDGAFGYACVCEQEVVAYGGMLLSVDEGQITNIAVRADVRRNGCGKAILTALEEEARKRGLVQISLEVRVSNAAAIALYEAFGYQTAGRRRGFYRRPAEDAFVMLKAL